MAKITILKGYPQSGKLDLSDHGISYVNKDRPVIWKLGKGCEVSAITDIAQKSSPTCEDIFSIPPHRDGSSTNWRAHIKANAETGAEYYYTIHWKDLKGDQAPPYDPILKVNP